jgi:hypothetical protein
MFFQRPRNLPDELWFLASAGYQHAYVTAAGVARLSQMERRVGLLRRLAQHYQSSSESITQSFGDAIEELHHFVALSHLSRAAVFTV